MEKKVVAVSGAMGYLGQAIVRTLAQEGYAVAILFRSNPPEEVDAFLSSLPPAGCKAFACDLKSEQEAARAFEEIKRDMGPLYACIHAAGEMPRMKQLNQLTAEEFKQEIESSLMPSFNFLARGAAHLKERKEGVLVGITTAGVVTERNTKARGAYSPMKFALQGLLVALREELAQSGVRVYSVAPGVMPGGLNEKTPQAFLDMVRALIPNKELMTAQRVAQTVLQLVAEETARPEMTILLAPEAEEN